MMLLTQKLLKATAFDEHINLKESKIDRIYKCGRVQVFLPYKRVTLISLFSFKKHFINLMQDENCCNCTHHHRCKSKEKEKNSFKKVNKLCV